MDYIIHKNKYFRWFMTFTAVITLQVFASISPAAQAPASSGNLIFILDASGSMWGQVEGTAKIVIFKEVLTGLVQDLLAGTYTVVVKRTSDNTSKRFENVKIEAGQEKTLDVTFH